MESDERFSFAREIRGHLVAQVRECITAGVFRPDLEPEVAFRLLTVGIVGVAVMRLSDRLGAEHADTLAKDVLDVTIAGLESGIALRSTGHGCVMDDAPAEASSQESLP